MIAVGLMLRTIADNNFEETQTSVPRDQPVMVRILNDPESKENNVRCIAEVTAVLIDSNWIACEAKTMLYLQRNMLSEQLVFGDELLVMKGVTDPTPPLNPEEFDYAAWLRHKGIAFVCFAKEKWEKKGHTEPSWIKARALELRRYFRERMITSGLTGQELAVSVALLLGQSSEIDPQLLTSYSASGTLHVLSVSGMHVALVFVVLLKLLSPLEKNKRGRWISFTVQIFVIWFYAFMTGMSPSVLRSVTMLSVIITGRIINRKSHLLNTLAASAIILLIGDPLLIEDAGFLLSYFAVAGIVIVQPMVEKWWSPKSKILKPIWSLISVTIAAQIFTFPLGLYFFQQFPTWFILTNMIIIPLSTICLYGGLVFLAFSWWTWLAGILAIAFGFLISLLNLSVSYTEFLPAAVIQTSGWNIFEIILLYAVIAGILFVFHAKIKRAVIVTGACLLVLLSCVAAGRYINSATSEITVFHINNGMVIGIAERGEVTLLTDSITLNKPEQFNFHVAPCYKKIGINDFNQLNLQENDSLLLNGASIHHGCLFKGETRIWCGYDTIVPDVIFDAFIIHAKNFWLLEEMQNVETHEIILTGEVKTKWIDKWKEEGLRRKIPVHVTGEQGARIFDI
jgi:competence protein ComEC